MIAKDLETPRSADPRLKAGHAAEAQLAFYLKRAFAADKGVHVLNGLRLERGSDAAQVDHLVVHPHGFIVVESKSVFGTLKVNERGEWLRSYKGRDQGMPSAKLQADRQAAFLRDYLGAHGFGHASALPADVLVAVSDGAVVHRPDNDPLTYLIKADAVPGRVATLIAERKPRGGLLGLFRKDAALGEGELAGLVAFLLEHHRPLRQKVPPPAQAEPVTPPPADAPAPPLPRTETTDYCCKTCGSERLEVHWGKHNYYFKCLDCGGSTAIRQRCGGCGGEERVRKQGPEFFGECGPCGRSERF